MVGRAKDEKRPKYTLGKSRKNGEKQPTIQLTKNTVILIGWYTFNDKQGAPGYSLKAGRRDAIWSQIMGAVGG